MQLLAELRQGLESLAHSKGKPPGQYQLSVAAPCGNEQMQVLNVRGMDAYLDFWNLMVRRPLISTCRSWEHANTRHMTCVLMKGQVSGRVRD